jgi:molybdopterin synthase sulfur carrier subunit
VLGTERAQSTGDQKRAREVHASLVENRGRWDAGSPSATLTRWRLARHAARLKKPSLAFAQSRTKFSVPLPMQLLVLAFAQARDRLGFSEQTIECSPSETPREILQRLAPTFSADGLRVAVDCEYYNLDHAIGSARELALIPPVSGG